MLLVAIIIICLCFLSLCYEYHIAPLLHCVPGNFTCLFLNQVHQLCSSLLSFVSISSVYVMSNIFFMPPFLLCPPEISTASSSWWMKVSFLFPPSRKPHGSSHIPFIRAEYEREWKRNENVLPCRENQDHPIDRINKISLNTEVRADAWRFSVEWSLEVFK